jgi:enoyl-CoA hydratase/carnithine racemase
MSNAFESLRYEKRESVAYITLNRPAVLNVFNTRMRDELYEMLGAVRDDPEVRVGVIKGEGRAFCAGADLSEFLTAPPPVEARAIRFKRDVWGLFAGLNKPFVAGVHGYVIGSGLEIALFCDMRIASEDAVFAMPEAGLGIIPAAGGSQTLPRTIGTAAALDMLLTCRRVEVDEALRLRLVNRVVPRVELESAVEQTARQIAAFDPAFLGRAKRRGGWAMDLSFEQAIDLESRLSG